MNEEALLPDLKLQLAINHPNLEDVWIEGFEQGQLAISEATNPYSADKTLYHYWSEGWWAGFYNESAIFNTEQAIAMHDELVGDVTLHCANDDYLNSTKSNDTGQLVFKSMVALFSGLAIYTLYDMAA